MARPKEEEPMRVSLFEAPLFWEEVKVFDEELELAKTLRVVLSAKVKFKAEIKPEEILDLTIWEWKTPDGGPTIKPVPLIKESAVKISPTEELTKGDCQANKLPVISHLLIDNGSVPGAGTGFGRTGGPAIVVVLTNETTSISKVTSSSHNSGKIAVKSKS
ncbi:unnamed protein product [[Candida] boidinii]|nr:unnamed protein product [[Candida] boidinii]